jgi:hypothetical protein
MALDTNPTTVMVPVAELAQMRADQKQIQELAAAREVEASAATLRASALSGQFEAMARSHRAEIEAERNRAGAIAAKAELATALAQQPLLPAAVGQLASILGPDVVATPDGKGGFQVLSKDYRSVGEFVQSKLADPAYAHFRADIKPQSPVNRPNQPSPETSIAEPSNLGHALIQNYQSQRQAADAQKSGIDPRLDPSQSFGLGGARGGSPLRGLLPGFGQSR